VATRSSHPPRRQKVPAPQIASRRPCRAVQNLGRRTVPSRGSRTVNRVGLRVLGVLRVAGLRVLGVLKGLGALRVAGLRVLGVLRHGSTVLRSGPNNPTLNNPRNGHPESRGPVPSSLPPDRRIGSQPPNRVLVQPARLRTRSTRVPTGRAPAKDRSQRRVRAARLLLVAAVGRKLPELSFVHRRLADRGPVGPQVAARPG
jgi:hypothetical protein